MHIIESFIFKKFELVKNRFEPVKNHFGPPEEPGISFKINFKCRFFLEDLKNLTKSQFI